MNFSQQQAGELYRRVQALAPKVLRKKGADQAQVDEIMQKTILKLLDRPFEEYSDAFLWTTLANAWVDLIGDEKARGMRGVPSKVRRPSKEDLKLREDAGIDAAPQGGEARRDAIPRIYASNTAPGPEGEGERQYEDSGSLWSAELFEEMERQVDEAVQSFFSACIAARPKNSRERFAETLELMAAIERGDQSLEGLCAELTGTERKRAADAYYQRFSRARGTLQLELEKVDEDEVVPGTEVSLKRTLRCAIDRFFSQEARRGTSVSEESND